MSDISNILSRISEGDRAVEEKLLPLVYRELRKLAAAMLANEKPGQTLQATALVHEAWLRLVKGERTQNWDSRGHFFAAAAESMRRILIESARRKSRLKHGGGHRRQDIQDVAKTDTKSEPDILAVSEALDQLEKTDPTAATLVKLRYFAGLNMDEVALALGISDRTAYYTWDYARSWLRCWLKAE